MKTCILDTMVSYKLRKAFRKAGQNRFKSEPNLLEQYWISKNKKMISTQYICGVYISESCIALLASLLEK